MLCRTFGKCLAGDPLDREIGALKGTTGVLKDKLFTYVRYNAELSKSGLRKLSPGLSNIDPEEVRKMDEPKNVGALQRIGEAVAKKSIDMKHFDGFLD
jgi:hypothetical protein